MGGYPLDCSASCSVSFPVPIKGKKFDEFGEIARNDEKARLDNYAIELQNDPSSTAYVIVYPGQGGRTGQVQTQKSRSSLSGNSRASTPDASLRWWDLRGATERRAGILPRCTAAGNDAGINR